VNKSIRGKIIVISNIAKKKHNRRKNTTMNNTSNKITKESSVVNISLEE